jgi:hypothetical protein
MSRLLKRFSRSLALFLLLLTGILLIHLNLGLFYAPAFTGQGVDKGLVQTLRFLRAEIRTGAAEKMQGFYPEGYFFMHMMYGLSWCEVAGSLSKKDVLYQEAMLEIAAAESAVNSPKGKSVFTRDLPIPYGVFYKGWSTYLLGKKIGLTGGRHADSTDLDRFGWNCADIATQFLNDKPVFPESYPRQSWPCDAVVGMACLALYDKTLDTNLYAGIIASWMKRLRTKLDSNGLVPHSVDYVSGNVWEAARGSSTSLMLNFWKEIDTAFAKEQFTLYKRHFLAYRFGLPGIREYPKGTSGNGDVDSGPVLLGIGGSASVVGLRTMALYGEKDIAVGLRNAFEVFGCSHSNGEEKYYLFGQLPMADAFIAWANSVACTKQKELKAEGFWKLRFQFYTGIVLVLIWFLGRRFPPRKRAKVLMLRH